MVIATLLHGIGTGLIGIFIAILIKQVQIIGFGDHRGGFLEIAVQAPPWRRMVSVTFGGFFGAASWYYLRGRRQRIVSVDRSLQGAAMPIGVTLVNAMIQDIVVALGGSFGREAAPREIAAMWGGQLADALGVSQDERKVLVACGTGAGLAAVYSVPISGTLYTIEHVLKWDVSLKTVVPATVTSVLATIVSSITVCGDGLYEMQRYSYSWPSKSLLLWSLMIGPLSGAAAVGFRRLVKWVEQQKPVPRLPARFRETYAGQEVQVLQNEERIDVTVLVGAARSNGDQHRDNGQETPHYNDTILVRFDGEDAREEEFNEHDWEQMQPEGIRDWHILIAMPTSFLALGILSQDFPTLLGNGRALGEVAIHRERTLVFFVMLLLLKVAVTAAAIGSGAAGGTLTPSVALGATLGAIVGEVYQILLPSLAPPNADDAPMSVIAAAAFLSISMTSPVTALWLLVEFSAQGVDRNDLLGLLRLDPKGLIRSKLAAGMILPMVIAVLGAKITVDVVGGFWQKHLKPPKAPETRRRHQSLTRGYRPGPRSSVSHDLDLPAHDEHEDIMHLSDYERGVCSSCFRTGLLLNTGFTVFTAAAGMPCPSAVTTVSVIGVAVSAMVGGAVWTWRVCYNVYEELDLLSPRETRPSQSGGSPRMDQQRPSLFNGDLKDELQCPPPNYTRHIAGGVWACFCSALGAWAALAPWGLTVWTHDNAEIAGLNACAASCIAVSACFAAFQVDLSHKPTVQSILRQTCIALVLSCSAGILGYICGVHVKGFRSALCQVPR